MRVQPTESGPAAGASDLWTLMQEIERLRYRAEILDETARTASPALRRLLRGLATQLREVAEQRYALARGERPPEITPLRAAE